MRHSPTIPERQRLPNRRAADFELQVAGLHYVVSVGRFADGRLAEPFVTNGKPAVAPTRGAWCGNNPPPDGTSLWAIVRRAGGYTLWRRNPACSSPIRCRGLLQFL